MFSCDEPSHITEIGRSKVIYHNQNLLTLTELYRASYNDPTASSDSVRRSMGRLADADPPGRTHTLVQTPRKGATARDAKQGTEATPPPQSPSRASPRPWLSRFRASPVRLAPRVDEVASSVVPRTIEHVRSRWLAGRRKARALTTPTAADVG